MSELFDRLKHNRINWDAAFVLLAGASPLVLPINLILFVDGVACVALVALGVVSFRRELKTEGQPDDWKVWSIVLPLIAVGIYLMVISAAP